MADFNMTREKAIKYAEAMKAKIQEKIEFYRRGNAHAPEVYYSDLAFLSAAISALREQEERQWIPVTEKLPEFGERVICTDGHAVFEQYRAELSCVYGMWDRFGVKSPMQQVTHWMPLPEPPKGE